MEKPFVPESTRNRQQSNSSSGRKLERVVFILTILIFVNIIVVLGYMYFKLKNQQVEKKHIKSPEKEIVSKPPPEYKAVENFLKIYMDDSVNPCNDFWQFACGKTPAKNKSLMQEIFQNQTTKIVHDFTTKYEDSSRSGSKILSLVARFYNSCLAAKENGLSGDKIPNPDLEMIRKIGGIPALGINKDENCQLFRDCYLNYLSTLGETFFMDFLATQNSSNTTKPSLVLQIHCLQNKQLNYSPDEATELIFQAFRMYKNNHYRKNNEQLPFVNQEYYNRTLRELLNIIKAAKDNLKESNKCDSYGLSSNKVETRELEHWIREMIASITEDGTGRTIQVLSGLNFKSGKVKRFLGDVFQHQSTLQTLLVGTYFVRYFLNKELFVDESHKDIAVDRSPMLGCQEETVHHLGWAVLKILMRAHNITERKLAKIKRIMFRIRQKFRQLLMNSPTLDHDSRVSALKKLDTMYARLVSSSVFLRKEQSFREYYKNLDYSHEIRNPLYDYNMIKLKANEFKWNKMKQILRNKNEKKFKDDIFFDSGLIDVNALYYLPNDFLVHLAFLVEPFFSLSYPPKIQYGLFGMVVGHEMGHAFGPGPLQYDFSGKHREWMTEFSKDQYNKNANCIRTQLQKGLFTNCSI